MSTLFAALHTGYCATVNSTKPQGLKSEANVEVT